MTNVMLKGGKEIDLLAVNPVSGEKFHIEVRITIGSGFKIRMVDTETKSGQRHRRGMDTLSAIKFKPPVVVSAIREIFGSPEYRKVLVAWEVEDETVIEQSQKTYGTEIWLLSDVLNELIQEVGTKAYRDDVLRTVQLISMRKPTA
jgi:hypothetical protein